MGLAGTLLKAGFAVAYPKQAAKLAHSRWDMKHSYAPRVSAIGVALIALPLGYLLGRMTRSSTVESRQRPGVEGEENAVWE